jgi:hypothetical protein
LPEFEAPTEPPTEPPQPPPAPRPGLGFRLPADYYTSPVTEVKPLFPRWVPIGCGSAALLFLIVLFIGGAFISRGGLGWFMDFSLQQIQNEAPPMYGSDATPQQRKAFDDEMNRLRAGVREGRVSMPKLQPVLEGLQDAISDKLLRGEELDKLVKQMREAQRPDPVKKPAR